MKNEKEKELTLNQKERLQIYNALCCLNIEIRDKQPRRAKYIQKMIQKWEKLL